MSVLPYAFEARVARQREERQERYEDYLELRSWGLSFKECAERLGVTLRTIERYERTRRENEPGS